MKQNMYLNQIERFYRGKMKSFEILKIGETPGLLTDMGAKKLPLIMKQSTLRKCIREPKGSRSAHQIERGFIEKLPEHVQRPILVVNDIHRNSFILISDYKDKNGFCTLVAILKEQNLNGKLVNEIKSIYGKEHLKTYLLKDEIQKGLKIIDNKKAKELFRVIGLQLPKALTNLDYIHSLSDSSGNVKNFQKNLEGGWIPQDTGKENQSSKMQSTQEALRKERLMYDVKLGKKTIATFESQEDARHFSDWKKFSLRQERFFQWEENYRKEHSVEPTTAEAEEELSEIAQNLENEVIMDGEEKALKEQGVEKPVAKNRIKLTLPKGLEPGTRMALENQLYKEGARYQKYTIPAEKSYTGAEINGKSWYVNPDKVKSMEPFQEYIKGSEITEKEMPEKESAYREGLERNAEKAEAKSRIKLTLPKGLEPDARIALERQLYKEGARYQKYTIPAEKSYTGAEINGKSWYVNPDRVESLEPFREYIKDSQVIEKEVPNALSTVQEGALTEKEVIKELRENGFRPTMSLTDRLTLLNEKAGKPVHLADVKEMLSADAEVDGEASEMRELAEGIAEECKAQEIAMQAMEVELE